MRLPPPVVVLEAAVSDHVGEAQLTVPLRADGTPAVAGASMDAANLQIQNRPVQAVTRSLVRLDDEVTELVGFIKIDVEGYELPELGGATRILEQDRPILLVESVRLLNPEAPENVFRFLGKRGYGGVFLFGERMTGIRAFDPSVHQRTRPDGGLVEPYAWNFIFLPDG